MEENRKLSIVFNRAENRFLYEDELFGHPINLVTKDAYIGQCNKLNNIINMEKEGSFGNEFITLSESCQIFDILSKLITIFLEDKEIKLDDFKISAMLGFNNPHKIDIGKIYNWICFPKISDMEESKNLTKLQCRYNKKFTKLIITWDNEKDWDERY